MLNHDDKNNSGDDPQTEELEHGKSRGTVRLGSKGKKKAPVPKSKEILRLLQLRSISSLSRPRKKTISQNEHTVPSLSDANESPSEQREEDVDTDPTSSTIHAEIREHEEIEQDDSEAAENEENVDSETETIWSGYTEFPDEYFCSDGEDCT